MTAQTPGLDRLLRLYPARYRAAHGDEIAEVHADATAGLTGLPLLREHASLVAHALRLRTRLSSIDPAGRIAAGAAPFTLAGAASFSLLYAAWSVSPLFGGFTGTSSQGTLLAVTAAECVPWIAALVCALTGRWTLARVAALLATAEKIAMLFLVGPLSLYLPIGYTVWLVCEVAVGVLTVVAPPDLVDVGRMRNRLVLGATALLFALPVAGLGLLLRPLAGSWLQGLLACWPGLLLSAGVLVTLSARRPDRLRALGIGLAALAWAPALEQLMGIAYSNLIGYLALVFPLVSAALLATVIRMVRSRMLPEPLDPA